MKVIPHHPTATSVCLWITAAPPERSWSVEVRVHGTASVVHRWSATRHPDRKLPNGVPGLPPAGIWRNLVSDLSPGESYDVVIVPTIRRARLVARFDTLPEKLPLRMLAASCYYVENDTPVLDALPLQLPAAVRRGRAAELIRKLRLWLRTLLSALPRRGSPGFLQGGVAQRYRKLYDSPATRPHLKVLMGDQVYLDAPVRDFYRHEPPASLARRVARSYQRSWDVLGEFLTLGANVCVSDDHEFWNDYPNDPPFLWRSLQDPEARAAFERAALDHLRWMQVARPTYHVTVGPRGSRPQLAVFVADTRIHRTTADCEDPRFMRDEDLADLVTWIDELRCPGVLVVGQPLIVAAAGAFDDNLRSYTRQYDDLCRALLRSAHDVVVVCGDSHFGRVSTMKMPDTGRRHIEVISSPLTVLEGAEASVSTDLPEGLDVFPPGAEDSERTGLAEWVNGVPGCGAEAICEDHAMLLGFSAGADGGVELTVGAYLMRHLDAGGGPKLAWTERFDLH